MKLSIAPSVRMLLVLACLVAIGLPTLGQEWTPDPGGVYFTEEVDPLDRANRAPGFPAGSIFSGFENNENVSLMNGNLVVSHPGTPTFPMDGPLSTGLTRVYNMKSVFAERVHWGTPTGCGDPNCPEYHDVPVGLSWIGIGWKMHLGRIFERSFWTGGPERYGDIDLVFEDPTGTEIQLEPVAPSASPILELEVVEGDWECSGGQDRCGGPSGTCCDEEDWEQACSYFLAQGCTCDCWQNPDKYRLQFEDGSWMMLKQIVPSTEYGSTTYIDNSDRNGWYTTEVHDRFGNYVEVIYYEGDNPLYPEAIKEVWLHDASGSPRKVIWTSVWEAAHSSDPDWTTGAEGALRYLNYLGPNGITVTEKYVYETREWPVPPGISFHEGGTTTTEDRPRLIRVDLPAVTGGTSGDIEYSYNNAARLTRIEYPLGGVSEYEYDSWNAGSRETACPILDPLLCNNSGYGWNVRPGRGVVKRTLYPNGDGAGQPKYSWEWDREFYRDETTSEDYNSFVVTNPDGSKIESTFWGSVLGTMTNGTHTFGGVNGFEKSRTYFAADGVTPLRIECLTHAGEVISRPGSPYTHVPMYFAKSSTRTIYLDDGVSQVDAQATACGTALPAGAKETVSANYQRDERHRWRLSVTASDYAKDPRISWVDHEIPVDGDPESGCRYTSGIFTAVNYTARIEGDQRVVTEYDFDCDGRMDQGWAYPDIQDASGCESEPGSGWEAWSDCSTATPSPDNRPWQDAEYDTAGNLDQMDYGIGSGTHQYRASYTHEFGSTKTAQLDGLSYVSSQSTVDPTGLVTSTTDPNGLTTNYSYDELQRLTEIDPPSTEYSTRAVYPTLLETRQINSGGTETTANTSDSEQVYSASAYDGLGRTIESRRLQPGSSAGMALQITRFDAMGRVVFASEWMDEDDYVNATTLSWSNASGDYFVDGIPLVVDPNLQPPNNLRPWGTVTFYGEPDPTDPDNPLKAASDAFGRPTKTVAADGATVETSYFGLHTEVQTNFESLTGVTQSVTRYYNDAYGRLVAVDSPSGGADAAYDYDINGNLVRVNLIPDDSYGGSGTLFDAWLAETISDGQLRKFRYDALGRLLASYHPENGYTTFDGYGDSLSHDLYASAAYRPTFPGFDALGNPLVYADSLGISRGYHFETAYDVAGRPLTVSQVPDNPSIASSGLNRLAQSATPVDGTFETFDGWDVGYLHSNGTFQATSNPSDTNQWHRGDYSSSCVPYESLSAGSYLAYFGDGCSYDEDDTGTQILRARVDDLTRADVLVFSFLRAVRENSPQTLDRFSVRVGFVSETQIDDTRLLFALDDDQASMGRWRRTPQISIADAFTQAEWGEAAAPKDVYLYFVFGKGDGVDPGLAKGVFLEHVFVGQRPTQVLVANTYDTDFCDTGGEHLGQLCAVGPDSNRFLGKLSRVESYDDGRLHSRRSSIFKGLNGRPSADKHEIDWRGLSLMEPFAATFAYDDQGNLDTRSGPDHMTTSAYTYEHSYRRTMLDSIDDVTDTPGVSLLKGVEYNPASGVRILEYGNGVRQTTAQDALYRPKSILVELPGASATLWDSGTYQYDPSGNIFKIGTQEFDYDAHGRLVQALVSAQAAGGTDVYTVGYQYDEYGNMTDRSWATSGQGGEIAPAKFEFASRSHEPSTGNFTNRIQSSGSDVFEYDPNGNLTDYPGTEAFAQASSAWDSRNRMRIFNRDPNPGERYPVEMYLYDAAGYRTVKLPLEGDGNPVISLRDGSGSLLAQYVVEADEAFPVLDKHFIHGAGQMIAERTLETPSLGLSVASGIQTSTQYGFRVTDPGPKGSTYTVDIRSDSGAIQHITGVLPDSSNEFWLDKTLFGTDETHAVRVKREDGYSNHYSPEATLTISSTVTPSSDNQIDVIAAHRSGNDIVVQWDEATVTNRPTYLYFERADGGGMETITTLPLGSGVKSHSIVSQSISVVCGGFFATQLTQGGQSSAGPEARNPSTAIDIAENPGGSGGCETPPPPTSPSPEFVTTFEHRDHLGSLRLVTDSVAAEDTVLDYYPFGTHIADDTVTASTNRFTGHERDGSTNSDYMLARYFRHSLARFVSVDPVVKTRKNVARVQRWNRYAYVENNPLIFVDPNGEDSFLVSRPLSGEPTGSVAHLFIVTHAQSLGDPNARVYSYGERADGNMGQVDGTDTSRFSLNTHATDQAAWANAGSDPNVTVTAIPAPDSTVAATAEALVPNQDYAALGTVFGLNSNSAAVAVAEESAETHVGVPGSRIAPGAGNADDVDFDHDGDGQPDPRRYQTPSGSPMESQPAPI